MQRNNTACGNAAPIQSPTPPVTPPEPTTPPATPPTVTMHDRASIALRAIGNRKTAIVAGAIILVGLFVWVPTLAAGLLFGGVLFGVNTLVDGKMGGRDHD